MKNKKNLNAMRRKTVSFSTRLKFIVNKMTINLFIKPLFYKYFNNLLKFNKIIINKFYKSSGWFFIIPPSPYIYTLQPLKSQFNVDYVIYQIKKRLTLFNFLKYVTIIIFSIIITIIKSYLSIDNIYYIGMLAIIPKIIGLIFDIIKDASSMPIYGPESESILNLMTPPKDSVTGSSSNVDTKSESTSNESEDKQEATNEESKTSFDLNFKFVSDSDTSSDSNSDSDSESEWEKEGITEHPEGDYGKDGEPLSLNYVQAHHQLSQSKLEKALALRNSYETKANAIEEAYHASNTYHEELKEAFEKGDKNIKLKDVQEAEAKVVDIQEKSSKIYENLDKAQEKVDKYENDVNYYKDMRKELLAEKNANYNENTSNLKRSANTDDDLQNKIRKLNLEDDKKNN
jgi:hypothetical protein